MEGRILEFNVDRQRLMRKRDCDFTGLVAGSIGYLKAKFNFSEEWDNCAKVACFEDADGNPYPIEIGKDGVCNIPAEAVTGERFYVSVIGGRRGYKLSTNEIKVRQEVN